MTHIEHSPYRDATHAAAIGLIVNLGLAISKLVGGIIGHSFALLSDAANSMGDVLTSCVVLFALRVAQKPADAEHPYGHTRIEAVAGSNVAVLIIVSALWIGWEAVDRFSTSHMVPPAWTLAIAGSNVVIKEVLYRYKMKVGKRTGSLAIIANAWDHRSDALCSLAVLIGLATVRMGGESYMWADDAAAMVVVAAILWTAFGLLRQSTHELMDAQADDEIVAAIRNTAQQVDGVLGVEKLWVRKSGLEMFADIHVQVAPERTVADGHRIGHEAKSLLLKEYPTLRDVLVHLEPYSATG
ncbi:cation diffusion facilitator family transporter [Aporhodopirellula aestuarii]|uniref:Cation diffusion facilitator family transporter n=1 Tax=Aporhodopirellula aestuarii TaxID=2950107 RepID=A0ABT0UAH8_9BACT|nr:cation diffusion facilitator family transporter [Aporhodopirellula aestuarii]MCM2373817.1 cation diffusion facilitator family transporter [Aporhodopirellula aestuarii]